LCSLLVSLQFGGRSLNVIGEENVRDGKRVFLTDQAPISPLHRILATYARIRVVPWVDRDGICFAVCLGHFHDERVELGQVGNGYIGKDTPTSNGLGLYLWNEGAGIEG